MNAAVLSAYPGTSYQVGTDTYKPGIGVIGRSTGLSAELRTFIKDAETPERL